ncbi:hypothetical protein TGAM01_v208549 [Trichoderma gamsii]|uniref:DUF3716 domain-containing protein n=1 Tax=Trichoderma gamsii TaxID=398673 RepID=A0A2P4ZEE5_9HYPO|nr:hypothetical protein TGAM01_v208549 [Trichoderma gamsii]PON22660.1 hypothetical protein TGAM01_v208549 [Trichoderma gamsii]
MEEAATWQDLPLHEHKFVWDEAEGKFWRDFNAKQEAQHSDNERKFQLTLTEAKVELGTLDGRRNQLSKLRERLALELSQLDKELAQVITECDAKTDRILAIERNYRHDEQDWLQQREKVTETMIRWFQEKREVAAKAQAAGNGTAGELISKKAIDASRSLAEGEATEMEGVEYWHEQGSQQTPMTLPAIVTRQVAAKTAITPLTPSLASFKGILQEPIEPIVDLVDADGRIIGPINKTEPWNQWVKAILGLPIKRPVKIRRGRKFTADHLAGIYEHTEAKGVKWLSCMIQAIGEVQEQRCVSCDKNQGAFDDCIIIGGPLFQKCGNCEWNRQGCHGAALRKDGGSPAADRDVSPRSIPQEEASTETTSSGEGLGIREVIEANGVSQSSPRNAHIILSPTETKVEIATEPSRRASPQEEPRKEVEDKKEPIRDQRDDRREQEIMAQQTLQNLQVRKEQAAQEALAAAAGFAQHAIQSTEMANSKPFQQEELKPVATERRVLPSSRPASYQSEHQHQQHQHQHHQLPALKEPRHEPARAYTFSSGFTPANVPSRPSSQDNSPTPRSIEFSPQPSDSADHPDLPKITRETLVLKHNGREYTYPEIIEGVPLEKIDPSHPYWDPKWPDIKSLIEPPLNQWREKHQQAMQSKDKGVDKASTRFQLGRQVNRGLKILEFLDEGDISPYQLLSKKYTTSGKGSITSYDTLFRLCETLSELAKYGLDIHPLEWMRQRLHELWLEQGAAFNVSRIIHNFYNDPKLALLRAKSGFKNIGRPSGVKASRRSQGAPSNEAQHHVSKRKSTYSFNGTTADHDGSSTDLTSEGGNDNPMMASESPVSGGGPISKRARTLSPSIRPYRILVDDTADFTDTDLWSGAALTKDDFGIDQIKSRLYTSSSRVTQYLHWSKQGRCLEHQVLKEGHPARWGVLKQPVNFDVRIDDVMDVVWNRRVMKAHFMMAERSSSSGGDSTTRLASKDGRPRGGVIVSFKRERTLRRLIKVLESMSVRTIEGSQEELEHRWAMMQSELLSDRDEEISGEEIKRPASASKLPVAY